MPTPQPSEQLQPRCYEHHVKMRLLEAFAESAGPQNARVSVRLPAARLRCTLRSSKRILRAPQERTRGIGYDAARNMSPGRSTHVSSGD
jgi:hypothetical protein